MDTRWRFTIAVPLYVRGKDEEGQDVVLYRVNVLLQEAQQRDSQPARPPFFVLRRFSQFRQLYDQLRAQLPEVMKDRGLAPPAKHALNLGGSKEMLDRRRQELERWLWRLLAQPDIARSAALRNFLEFSRALTKAQAARQQQAQGHPGHSRAASTGPTPALGSPTFSNASHHSSSLWLASHTAATASSQQLATAELGLDPSLSLDPPEAASAPGHTWAIPGHTSASHLAVATHGAHSGSSASGSSPSSAAATEAGPSQLPGMPPQALDFSAAAVASTAGARGMGSGLRHGSAGTAASRALSEAVSAQHVLTQALGGGSRGGQGLGEEDFSRRASLAGSVGQLARLGEGLSAVGQGEQVRLGLRLESRADLRRLLESLEQRLEKAGRDLSAAQQESELLGEANRLMGARLVELELEVQAARQASASSQPASCPPPGAEQPTPASLQAQLDQATALIAELQEQVQQLEVQAATASSRAQSLEAQAAGASAHAGVLEGRVEELEGQVGEAAAVEEGLRAALADSEDIRGQLSRQLAQAEEAGAGRLARLGTQVSSLQQQLAMSQAEHAQLLASLRHWDVAVQPSASAAPATPDGLQAGSGEANPQPTMSTEALALLTSRLATSEAQHQAALAALAHTQSLLEAAQAAGFAPGHTAGSQGPEYSAPSILQPTKQHAEGEGGGGGRSMAAEQTGQPKAGLYGGEQAASAGQGGVGAEEVLELRAALAAAAAKVSALEQDSVAAARTAREKQVVLAKEVKRLRAELATAQSLSLQLQQQAAQAGQKLQVQQQDQAQQLEEQARQLQQERQQGQQLRQQLEAAVAAHTAREQEASGLMAAAKAAETKAAGEESRALAEERARLALELQLQAAQDQASETQELLAAALFRVEGLEQQAAEAQKQLTLAQQQAAELQQQLEGAGQQVSLSRQQQKEQQQQMQSFAQQAADLQQQLSLAQAGSAAAQHAVSEASQRAAELEQQLQAAEAQAVSSHQQMTAHQQQAARLQQQVTEGSAAAAAATAAAQQQAVAAQQQLCLAQQQLGEAQQAAEAAGQQVKDLEKEVARLKDDLAVQQEQQTANMQALSAAQAHAQLQAVQAVEQQLRAQAHGLSGQVERLEAELQGWQRQQAGWQAKVEALQQQVQQLEVQVAQQEAELQVSKQGWQVQEAALQQQVDQLQAEMTQVGASDGAFVQWHSQLQQQVADLQACFMAMQSGNSSSCNAGTASDSPCWQRALELAEKALELAAARSPGGYLSALEEQQVPQQQQQQQPGHQQAATAPQQQQEQQQQQAESLQQQQLQHHHQQQQQAVQAELVEQQRLVQELQQQVIVLQQQLQAAAGQEAAAVQSCLEWQRQLQDLAHQLLVADAALTQAHQASLAANTATATTTLMLQCSAGAAQEQQEQAGEQLMQQQQEQQEGSQRQLEQQQQQEAAAQQGAQHHKSDTHTTSDQRTCCLQQQLEAYTAKVAAQAEELQHQQAQLLQHQQQAQEWQAGEAVTRQQAEALAAAQALGVTLQQQLAESGTAAAAAQAQLQAVQAVEQQLRAQAHGLSGQVERLEAELQGWQQQQAGWKAKVEALQQQVQQLEGQVAQREAELQASKQGWQVQEAALQQQVDQLQGQVELQDLEAGQLQGQLSGLQAECVRWAAREAALQAEGTAWQGVAAEAQDQVIRLQQLLSQAEQQGPKAEAGRGKAEAKAEGSGETKAEAEGRVDAEAEAAGREGAGAEATRPLAGLQQETSAQGVLMPVADDHDQGGVVNQWNGNDLVPAAAAAEVGPAMSTDTGIATTAEAGSVSPNAAATRWQEEAAAARAELQAVLLELNHLKAQLQQHVQGQSSQSPLQQAMPAPLPTHQQAAAATAAATDPATQPTDRRSEGHGPGQEPQQQLVPGNSTCMPGACAACGRPQHSTQEDRGPAGPSKAVCLERGEEEEAQAGRQTAWQGAGQDQALVEVQAARILELQEALRQREELLQQQAKHLQHLTAEVARLRTAAAAAAAAAQPPTPPPVTLCPANRASSDLLLFDEEAAAPNGSGQAQPAAGDLLLALDDEDSTAPLLPSTIAAHPHPHPGLAHTSSAPAPGLPVDSKDVFPGGPPAQSSLLTNGGSSNFAALDDSAARSSHAQLLQQLADMKQQLAEAQQQLDAMRESRDAIALELASARAALGTHSPSASPTADPVAEMEQQQLVRELLAAIAQLAHQGARLLQQLQAGDIAPALAQLEQAAGAARAAAAVGLGGGGIAAGKADEALDKFMARLTDSNQQLNALQAMIKALEEGAKGSDPGAARFTAPVGQLPAKQLRGPAQEAVTGLRRVMSGALLHGCRQAASLNELRCEKALVVASETTAALAASRSSTATPHQTTPTRVQHSQGAHPNSLSSPIPDSVARGHAPGRPTAANANGSGTGGNALTQLLGSVLGPMGPAQTMRPSGPEQLAPNAAESQLGGRASGASGSWTTPGGGQPLQVPQPNVFTRLLGGQGSGPMQGLGGVSFQGQVPNGSAAGSGSHAGRGGAGVNVSSSADSGPGRAGAARHGPTTLYEPPGYVPPVDGQDQGTDRQPYGAWQ